MNTVTVPVTVADSQTVAIGSTSGDLPIRTYPFEIPIVGRIHRDYQFTKPISLIVERDDDGSYVLSDEIFGVFGNAFTLKDAVQDYISAFIGYYELLSAHQDAPSVALFQELKRYFQPVG